ncbi:MAG TPA: SAM-dependent methyltransferase, partial [Pirellulales bacterium]|nr:SAM-dependent methyltransferase [Pirellulales bacterium]
MSGLRAPCVAFAAQCLPDALGVSATSVSQWAAQTGQWLIERLRGHAGPWRLHVFCVPTTERRVTPARCRYIEQGIAELLRKKQRRLLRTWNRDPRPLPTPDEWLVQFGLRTSTAGYGSAVDSGRWHDWRRCVSRFPGGVVGVAGDRQAPSRAFAKLAEVELRLARPILAGETCVDLGSSPGSWAYWALRRGAHVVAVDRSPLRADLMRHDHLTFLQGDAFRYQPAEPVDWLLCDVVAFPSRILELVQRWLARGWCRHFCVTIKFRGQGDYAKIEPLKASLSAGGHDFYLRRLTANKNEVTLFGA